MHNFRPKYPVKTRPQIPHRKEFFDMGVFVRKAQDQKTETYTATHTFDDFGFSPQLVTKIKAKGYTTPTSIQDQAIPALMQGQDVIGLANTGSGKTAAFLLPLIEKVNTNRTNKVLILAPTRELAVQINDEFKFFGKALGLYSSLCIGGLSMGMQIRELRHMPHFVIGTPGRIKDLSNQRALNLSDFTTVVLDEVDRMLDMGFIVDIKYLIAKLPTLRQSIGFSATMPEPIKKLMYQFLKNPVVVSVKASISTVSIDQDVVHVGGRTKADVLQELLIKPGFDKVLVFGRTKHGIDKLAKSLGTRGQNVVTIHGNKSQGQRQSALNLFKTNRVKVLIATDIASRGLDIDDVTHVINYDLPESYEDYTHRIGRTARAGKKGIALTFV